jgi:hypothetical protein
MSRWISILLTLVTVLVCYLCFTHTHLVIRSICFLVAAFWLFVSWMLFDRIKLGDEWFQSQTGKAGAPGSVRACIFLGLAALGVGCVFGCCAFLL